MGQPPLWDAGTVPQGSATLEDPVERAEPDSHRLSLLPVLSGLVVGCTEVLLVVSLAALIFSGPLAVHLPAAVGAFLLGGGAVVAWLAWRSTMPGAVGSAQDAPAVILSLVAASIAARLPAGETETFLTVMLAIVLSALLTGVLFLTLGVARLGNLVRFVPYPVIAGFLAGTGWLVLNGAFGILTGLQLTPGAVSTLLASDVLLRWAPAFGFAAVLLAVLRHWSHPLLIPVALALAGMTFYVVLFASGWSVREAEAAGWLVGPLPGGSLWEPAGLRALVSADWWVVLAEAGSIATLLLFAVIGLLLNSSAMEVALERDADLNGELRTAGVANLLAGASGGLVGYHALILTVLADRMNARSRVTGLTAAAVCVIVMLAGSSLLALIPKPVLGGLLLLVGLDLLITWTYDTRLRMPRAEHVVVLLIVAVMATGGLLQGVGVGLVAAAALFVVTYSRADIVKHTLTGASYQSAVDRPPEDQSILRDHGDQTLIIVLQGFLFFGTASSLVERVRNRLEDVERPALQHVVVDFRRVTGLDTSAVQSFIRLHRRLHADGATLILAAVPGGVRRQLELGGVGEDAREGRRYAPDVDHAAQWCEEDLLAAASADARGTADRRVLLGDGHLDDRLLRHVHPLHLAAGSCLIEEGADPDGLYFLAAGRLTVQLNGTNGTVTRLREIGAGAVVGELSHYLGIARTASVVAHEPSLVYRLSAEQMAAMERTSPELAAELHQQLARLLAQRLTDTVRSLRALLE